MIPKIIHYCWFGGNPLPPLAQVCIASWRKYLSDYEVWMWTEEHPQDSDEGLGVRDEYTQYADKVCEFDVNMIPYTAEAYRQKKYAFVSDYCRFYVIQQYGGVYFDTDVEVIRPIDDIIAKGAFLGYELDPNIKRNAIGQVAPGLGFAFPTKHPLVTEILNYYHGLKFDMLGGQIKTIVGHTTDVLVANGLTAEPGIQHVMDTDIYPAEYFCPIHNITKRLHITGNTRSIHRYMDSWNDKKGISWKDKVRGYLPEWVLLAINRMKN